MFGTTIFDNRELAIVLWAGVLLALLLFRGGFRQSARSLIATAASPTLSVPLALMVAYVGGIVVALWAASAWTWDLFSETLFWFFGTALVLFVSLERANRDPRFFRHTVVRVLSLTVFVQFVVNLYAMNLLVEVLLVPTSVLLGGMLALSQLRPALKSVRGCVEGSIAVLGVILLLYSVRHVVQDPGAAFTIANGRELLVPVALTVLLLPLLYVLALYLCYSTLLSRLRGIVNEQPGVYRRARRRLLLCSRLSLRSVVRASRAPWWLMLSRPPTEHDVDAVISHIKSRRAHALALPASTKGELARIMREEIPGWEYTLFAARLDAGARALAFVHPAHNLTERAFAPTPNEQQLWDLIQKDSRDSDALVQGLESVFDHDRVEQSFGRPGEPGDSERIIGLAEEFILGYDRMLAWTDRSRATKAPNRMTTLATLHSQLLDQPNQQIEDYIDRWNEVAARIPELVADAELSAEPITIDMELRLTIDQTLLDRFTAEARRLRRAS